MNGRGKQAEIKCLDQGAPKIKYIKVVVNILN